MSLDKERLDAFEKMLKAVEEDCENVERQMAGLKAEGKTKSATYRQLMGRHMNLQNMLAMYRIYGLLDERET